MELAADDKTAGTLVFSWLPYGDSIVLNSSPVPLCVGVNLAVFRKGNLRHDKSEDALAPRTGQNLFKLETSTKPTKSHVKGR